MSNEFSTISDAGRPAGKEFSSLDALRGLSDRDLNIAVFLLLSALAEKVTGKVPCILFDKGREIPSLLHGGDGRIAWLPTTPEEDARRL